MAIKVYSPTDFEDTSSGVSIDGNLVVNTSVLYVDTANDRVGIGTTSPSRKLHVIGGDVYVPTTSDTVGTGSYGGNSFELRNSATGEHFNVDVFNRTTATWYTPFHIQNTGNVGIGTTSPSAKLDVAGNAEFNGETYVRAQSNVGLRVQTIDQGLGGSDGLRVGLNAIHAFVWNFENTPLSFATNGSQKATILANGNVGIGTTSPSSKLHVVGPINIERTGVAATSSIDMEGNFRYIAANGYAHAFFSQGSEMVRFYSGNVGIGITSPQRPLDVNGDIQNNGVLRRAGLVFLKSDGTSTKIGPANATAGDVSIHSSGTLGTGDQLAVFKSSGNVGIGTTGPQKKLDVNGSGIVASLGGAFSVGSFAGFHFGYSETTYGNDLYKKSALVFERTDNHSQGGNASGKIHFLLNNIGNGSATSLAHSVVTIDTDAVATQGSARVGIGTTSPTEELHIEGEVKIQPKHTTGTPPSLYLGDLNNEFQSGMSSTGHLTFRSTSNTYFQTGGANYRMMIDSTGNVGIGTTSPDFKLDVAGDIGIDDKIYHNGDHNTYISLTGDAQTFRTGGTDRVTIDNTRVTMSSPLRIDTTGTALEITGTTTVDSSDVSIYLGNSPSAYGFYITYVGTGGGNTNALRIQSTNAGTPKTLLISNQDGIVNFPTGLQLNGAGVATQSWVGSQSYATQTYVNTAVSNLVDSAPSTLDTLNELAAALGDDPNFATTVTNSIATKLPLSGGTMTGIINTNSNISFSQDSTGVEFYSVNSLKKVAGRGMVLEVDTSRAASSYLEILQSGTYYFFWNSNQFSITDVSNWNTAYSWGDHSGQYLPINGGTVGGAVTINGPLVVNGTITENSSLRVKENIITSEGHLEKVNKLRPVKYNKIDSDKTEIGLIAEEVEEVYPEFIQYDENGDPIGIHYSRLTASLIGAVKELTKEVEELKSKING